MREIKYQGYDGKFLLPVARIHFDGDGEIFWSPDCNCYWLFNIRSYPIRQYIGLKDKNGKEIYEGDILRYDDVCSDSHILNTGERIIGVVKWIPDRAQFMPQDIKKNHKGGHYVAHWDFMTDAEILGSIYENPELLEATNV